MSIPLLSSSTRPVLLLLLSLCLACAGLCGAQTPDSAPGAALRERLRARMESRTQPDSSPKPTPQAAGSPFQDPTGYDPLAPLPGQTPEPLYLLAKDSARSREIPLKVYLPATTSPAPVVLYSHGLGGSRETSTFLGKHWAARGYIAVFLQHPGSDTSVWQDKAGSQRMNALTGAADFQNFMLRTKDVPAVIDQLTAWNKQTAHPLHARMNLDRLGMSGHSFGAVTTQAVSGQSFPTAVASFTDPRIRAAIAFSPSVPTSGRDPKSAFGNVKIPWMLMTGTHDESALFPTLTAESRQLVYPALPPGNKYELVLQGAEHSVFTDRPLPGEREPRNPRHHRSILALSTAFWDACLRGDAAAQSWLDGDGPRSVLDRADRWQRK